VEYLDSVAELAMRTARLGCKRRPHGCGTADARAHTQTMLARMVSVLVGGARQKVRGAIVDAVRPAEPRLPARGLWDGGDPSAREGDAIGRLHSELPH